MRIHFYCLNHQLGHLLGPPQEANAQTHLVVIAGAEEDVGGCGVPLHQAHSAGVAHQLLPAGCQVLCQQLLGDVPDLNLSGDTWPQGQC